jgi:hypothetical protein
MIVKDASKTIICKTIEQREKYCFDALLYEVSK